MLANERTIICSYSVRTGAINRFPTECTLLLFMYNQYLHHEHVIFTPRALTFTPTCIHCREPIYRARISRNVCCGLSMYTNVYPRTSTVMRDCIYIIRVNGRDKLVPYAYGMYSAIVYAQPMFTPRTRNIYPRTPMFTPRASTVGSRFIVPAYHGMYAADCPCTPTFILVRPL